MLRIRLRRVGKKGNPSYRIVVAESTSPRDGKYLEWIGNYDPMANPPAITLKEDRATQWLSKGAQPSDAVARILDKAGILERAPLFRNTKSAATEEPVPASPLVPTAVVTATTPAAVEEPAEADEAPVEAEDSVAVSEEAPTDEAPVEAEDSVAVAEEAPAEEAPAEEVVADEASDEPADVETPDGDVSDEAAKE